MAWTLRSGSTLRESGENTNITVTLPTHQAGDILINVACVSACNGTSSSDSHGIANPPSGWTTLYAPSPVYSTVHIRIDAKIAASSSETNPQYTITGSGTSQTFSCRSMAWQGGPTTLTGIVHASNVASNTSAVHPYVTPSLTVTQDNTLILYATTLSNDAWQQSGSSYPNSCTGLNVSDADVNNPLLYANLGFLLGYTIQTTAANVSASSWSNGNSTNLRYVSLAVSLLPGSAPSKYLKLLAHSSAASATGVEGVVLNAARDTVIGEFTGQAFEASLESGEAVLLIPVEDITPDGSTLTTTDTPLVSAYNSTDGTVGLGSATVIEV